MCCQGDSGLRQPFPGCPRYRILRNVYHDALETCCLLGALWEHVVCRRPRRPVLLLQRTGGDQSHDLDSLQAKLPGLLDTAITLAESSTLSSVVCKTRSEPVWTRNGHVGPDQLGQPVSLGGVSIAAPPPPLASQPAWVWNHAFVDVMSRLALKCGDDGFL